MLIIDRRPGQSVTIGNAVVTVLKPRKSGKVALAIDAPRCVPIVRDDANRKEPREAVSQKRIDD